MKCECGGDLEQTGKMVSGNAEYEMFECKSCGKGRQLCKGLVKNA